MTPLTLTEIVHATAGSPTGPDPGPIAAVCTDTRDLRSGSLFVALRGDTFDGHAYLAQAAAGGAVAALVDRDVPAPPGMALVRVDDARRAMGRLATFVRRRFNGTVIAVAGSNGKTGTKHLIHAALSSCLRGSMSPKSFNNDVGVPVTLFAADETDDYVIVEVGTNHPGEIAHLSRMCEPDVAVITSIGAEHLEFFGDLAGVARENMQIVDGMRPGGPLFVNADDNGDLMIDLLDALDRPEVMFGFSGAADLCVTDAVCDAAGVRFRVGFDGEPFFVPLLGRHTAANAAAAVGVGRHLGLSDDDISRGLAAATGPAMRLQLDRVGDLTIINDAYNANPTSMRAALETLRDLPAPGRRVAVLGDMLELGDAGPAEHAAAGALAAACGVDLLVAVGPLATEIAAAATAAGLPAVTHVGTSAEAAIVVPPLLRGGDLVLLKASRGVRLERVAEAIRAAR